MGLLTKMNFMSLEMKNNVILITTALIIAIFSSAPFVHTIMPKNSSEVSLLTKKIESQGSTPQLIEALKQAKIDSRYYNFRTKRLFWYSIGKPIAMTFFGLFFLSISPAIVDRNSRFLSILGSLMLTGIGFFFIIWCIWVQQDYSNTTYFVAMMVMAVASTSLSYFFLLKRKNLYKIIQDLFQFIIVDINNKYIPKEKKEDFVNSYNRQIEKAVRNE